jgi:hypothetical protein
MTALDLLVLCAAGLVAISLFWLLWLLGRLVASTADESASLPWWHFMLAGLLFAASTLVIVYLT